MLLAVDIGNTNTVFGLFDGARRCAWTGAPRPGSNAPATNTPRSCAGCSSWRGSSFADVTAGIISSVVPPATGPIERFFRRYLDS